MSRPELPILQTITQREQALLAPFAFHSAQSRGRRHADPEHPYRGPFQRDRDRILHSAAYRRLSGKMQVFTGDMGDYHRTRLTHTHEVASVARTIGRTLKLNEDLIEALALFHDIGHPPYGHAGEDALAACLADQGGFSHNQYALTIAEHLERRYPEFPGLNLSFEVLDGQATRADKSGDEQAPLLEVQLVDVADSTAYDAHDTDDAVKLELVTLEELQEVEFARQCVRQAKRKYANLQTRMLRKAIVHEMIDRQVSDVLRTAARSLAELKFADSQAARESGYRLQPSQEMQQLKDELESFLYQRVYRHPKLVHMRASAQQRLLEMFQGFVDSPQWLPMKYQQRCSQVGLHRSVAEYLAGMTDRYCDDQYRTYFQRPTGD